MRLIQAVITLWLRKLSYHSLGVIKLTSSFRLIVVELKLESLQFHDNGSHARFAPVETEELATGGNIVALDTTPAPSRRLHLDRREHIWYSAYRTDLNY